jgi:hypothetical protein
MPIGPPLYVPEPKSGCSSEDAPMVAVQVEEFADAGNRSTRVFQMLSAGSTVQLPAVGAWAEAISAKAINRPKVSSLFKIDPVGYKGT